MTSALEAQRTRVERLARDEGLSSALVAISDGEASARLETAGVRREGAVAISSTEDVLIIQRQGDGWEISGELRFVVSAASARWIVAPCDVRGVRHWTIIARDAAGLVLDPIYAPAFPSVAIAHARLARCRVPHQDLVHEVDDGPRAARRLLGAAATIVALEAAASDTLAFVGNRTFRGRTLADQQVVRDRLAGIVADVAILRAHLDAVFRACVMRDPDASAVIAMNAVLVTARAPGIAAACAQLLGGRGYLVETRVARLYREMTALGLLVAPPRGVRAMAAGALMRVQS